MKPNKQRTVGKAALAEGAAVLVALGFDLLGEPSAAWHPVVWFGKLIRRLERAAPQGQVPQLLYGLVMLALAAPVRAIARAYLKPGLKAAIIGPTSGEYRVASLAAGATVVEFLAQATEGVLPDTMAVAAWILREQPCLVWLCNPNNPTGTWLDPYSVLHVAEACRKTGALLVVDEAYWHFVFPHEAYSAVKLVEVAGGQQVMVLRSLTKDFALAGLRLGYAVATPAVIERLGAQLPSWNVNGVAQAAAVAALADRMHLKTTLDHLAVERRAFYQVLSDAGLHVVPSRTHFCLVEVGNACYVRQQLLARKILVRGCTSFGLPQFIRVAIRPMCDWQQLLFALQEII